ncbi:MAG TPA: YceI family protein [Steroidobacteraceae bacterium]|nr:YceI family protein [Steroidobacteraceae bacterium]
MSTRWVRRGFPLGVVVAGLTLWGLIGCQTSPPSAKPGPAATAPSAPGAPPAGAREYAVIAEESLLQILVYRGGAMARLGHNHVIASHHMSGSVYVADDLLQSRFDISVPVNELTIDEPAMREQAGADFPPGVPQSARDGTRRNMLSDALLDGEKYPAIRLRATDIVAAAEGYDVGVEITIKDQVHVVRVPVTFDIKEDAVVARGEFPLKQSELGFKPFSVAMGTLVVLDEMRIHFEVHCQALRATTENAGHGPASVKMGLPRLSVELGQNRVG